MVPKDYGDGGGRPVAFFLSAGRLGRARRGRRPQTLVTNLYTCQSAASGGPGAGPRAPDRCPRRRPTGTSPCSIIAQHQNSVERTPLNTERACRRSLPRARHHNLITQEGPTGTLLAPLTSGQQGPFRHLVCHGRTRWRDGPFPFYPPTQKGTQAMVSIPTARERQISIPDRPSAWPACACSIRPLGDAQGVRTDTGADAQVAGPLHPGAALLRMVPVTQPQAAA